MRLLTTARAVFGFLIALNLPAQNLLVNGSFEIGFFTNSLHAGDTNLTGWMITGARSLYWVSPGGPNPLTPVNGDYYVDLNGKGGEITLSQSFLTAPGETYEVSFTVGSFQGLGYSVEAGVLSSNDVAITNVIASAPTNRGWASPTKLRFVATTGLTTLRITDTTATVNYDLTLDGVSVERVTPRVTIECSQVRLCWDSVTNQQYQLQFLTNGAWANLGAPIAGTGGRDCSVQPVTNPQQLFRVMRVP